MVYSKEKINYEKINLSILLCLYLKFASQYGLLDDFISSIDVKQRFPFIGLFEKVALGHI